MPELSDLLSRREVRLKSFLDGLYFAYSRKELINPDPLWFLHECGAPDREVVGLIASSLAYGRVAQIMKSIEFVLSRLGPSPRKFLTEEPERLRGILGNFKHRFTTSADMERLLINIASALSEYGSVEKLMASCLERANDNLFNALDIFSDCLSRNEDGARASGFSLVTAPRDGSACKRLFLFLKWMVRHDDVDPGGWTVISPRRLIMPTDTHIHAISLRLGLTKRKQADLKAAVEITGALARLCPDDPTRYDFVLTRFGIRDGLSVDELTRLAEAGTSPAGKGA